MRRALTWWTALLALLLPTLASANPSQEVMKARVQYDLAAYANVVAFLKPQLEPRLLISDENELREARRMLGVSYFYLNNKIEARQQFNAILSSDPDFSLDPVAEAEDVVTFFKEIKEGQEAMLERIRRLQELEKLRADALRNKNRMTFVIERRYRDQKSWANWIPFGGGQFKNGQTGWGVAFAVTEGVLIGVSTGIFVYQISEYGAGGLTIHRPLDKAERSTQTSLRVIQVGTGVMAVFVYAASVYHAYANQKPDVITLPPRQVPADSPELTPTKTEARFIPYISPDGAGLGVSWEF